MARNRGPEEFFEAFRQASRPKATLPPKTAKVSKRTKVASPVKAQQTTRPKPVRSHSLRDGDKVINVRQSTVGVATVTALLLVGLAILVGRVSVTHGSRSERLPLAIEESMDDQQQTQERREEATVTRTNLGSDAKTLRKAPARPTPPRPDSRLQGRYELRLITYKNSPRMVEQAGKLLDFLNKDRKLRAEKVTAAKRVIGRMLVVNLGPFESRADARAKRVLTAVNAMKYEMKTPFTGATFYKLNR